MKLKRFLISLYAVLLLLAAFPTRAWAIRPGTGSYHPPCITLLVYNAPEGLTASIEMESVGKRFPVTMEKETRLWETQFRVFREGVFAKSAWFGNEKDFLNAVLILHTESGDIELPIPADELTHGGNEDFLSYNFRTGAFQVGMYGWRMPLLFALRMVLLLLVKSLLLYLYRYRRESSWRRFFIANLISLGAVNLFINSWGGTIDASSAYPALLVAMLVVLLFEIVTQVLLLDEYDPDTATNFTVAGNVTSCVLLFLIVTYFPV